MQTRTETFTEMLDRAETPLQTMILLGQLQMLRKLERERAA